MFLLYSSRVKTQRLLHPHTCTHTKRRHQQFFLDNSEIPINMKQTKTNRDIWNTESSASTVQQGQKLPTQHENSVATSVPIRSSCLYFYSTSTSFYLLPIICLQGFLVYYSYFIATIFPRWLKGADTHFILFSHTELDYRNYLSFSFDLIRRELLGS